MRSFLFLLTFFVKITFFLTAEETKSFIPLAYNERFAYSLQAIRAGSRIWQRMTVYAVRNNDTENAIELFSWEHINTIHIQFTCDLKKWFFVESLLTGNSGTAASWTHNLYMANGHTGEIRRLQTNIGGRVFRVSNDGRFVLFQSREPNKEFAQLVLFDIKKNAIISEFEWIVKRSLAEQRASQHWVILRFDNIFRIYELGEHEIIIAVAELDPTTMEFRTIWDYSNMPEFPSVPWMGDDNWVDDVMLLLQNPNVFLQR